MGLRPIVNVDDGGNYENDLTHVLDKGSAMTRNSTCIFKNVNLDGQP